MENETFSSTSPSQDRPYRPARSKDGCLTCRRRKVRCNEVKPRCSHCRRLNLECKWRTSANTPAASQVSSTETTSNQHRRLGSDLQGQMPVETTPNTPQMRVDGQFDDVFNYASFMWNWNGSPKWPDQESNEIHPNSQINYTNPSLPTPMTPVPDRTQPSGVILPGTVQTSQSRTYSRGSQMDAIGSNELLNDNQVRTEDRILTDYFIGTVVPPILSHVETQQKWSSMRQLLMSMFNESLMVRHSILAFAELLLYRQSGSGLLNTHSHYDKAVAELSQKGKISSLNTSGGPLREHLLATLFFLSYIDLLEDRIQHTHASLKKTFDIFQASEKHRLRPVEVRLLSWIRLLDARAVSAGGEGLFLSDDDESLLAYPSPNSTTDNPTADRLLHPDGEIEEVLFNLLYQPGYIFFSKAQSFMGRISKIDPWHRSRGTVEDETEVMSIASKISKDLNTLYETRPPLMDYAVAGSLTSQHVAPEIAVNITRAFRTYLSNYHASKIHLHRVAYKSLPLTSETQNALSTIRHLARLMVEGPDGPEMLPVNMLWPLLMWGCEEKSQEEREWIKAHILNMENVATNARITAQVLEEVQARQDTTNQRVDVRSVMHEIFDSCFAIV